MKVSFADNNRLWHVGNYQKLFIIVFMSQSYFDDFLHVQILSPVANSSPPPPFYLNWDMSTIGIPIHVYKLWMKIKEISHLILEDADIDWDINLNKWRVLEVEWIFSLFTPIVLLLLKSSGNLIAIQLSIFILQSSNNQITDMTRKKLFFFYFSSNHKNWIIK